MSHPQDCSKFCKLFTLGCRQNSSVLLRTILRLEVYLFFVSQNKKHFYVTVFLFRTSARLCLGEKKASRLLLNLKRPLQDMHYDKLIYYTLCSRLQGGVVCAFCWAEIMKLWCIVSQRGKKCHASFCHTTVFRAATYVKRRGG